MAKTRIKNPNADRPALVHEIKVLLREHTKDDALQILITYFTTVDLIGIRDQLRATPLVPPPSA